MVFNKINTNHIDPSRLHDSETQVNVSTTNITVEVSGSRFCIVPSLFKHIEDLHWKKPKSKSRQNKILKLNANPDIFESVLQFFLYAKLPDSKSLSTRMAKTLIDFVSPLDPVEVRPLVEYLKSFVVEKSSTAKTSFIRQSFTSLSSPFHSRGSRSKCKPSSQAGANDSVDRSTSHASSNIHKPKNSDIICFDRASPGKHAPLAVASSIPTHIEHPVATSATIAEISVCSMDESSSVSKLSFQSSSTSWGTTVPPGPQTESSMRTSSSNSTYRQLHHSQNQYQHNTLRLDGNSVGMNKPRRTQDSGFYMDCHVRAESHVNTSIDHDSKFITKLESLERISNEYYLPNQPKTVVKDNSPFIYTQNLMTDVPVEKSERNCFDTRDNSSTNHKVRPTTKIIRTVLGGNRKNHGSGSSNFGKGRFYWKQGQMTHADWCASEYVV